MIEYILVKNFQPHKKFRVDLDPHITTFVGPNDVGKTAIIRALGWLCFNRPSGTDFIRKGSKAAILEIGVDGRRIRRKRGKRQNTYELDGKTFKAMGTDVPEPIADLLNVNAINFQSQHDAPFWFSLTPQQVAKELNRVVDLTIIDESLARAATRVRETKTIAEYAKARLSQSRAKRSELRWIKDCRDDYTNICTLRATLEGGIENRANLSDSLAMAIKHDERAQTLAIASEAANSARLAGRKLAKIAARRAALAELLDNYSLLNDCTAIAPLDLSHLLAPLQELKEQTQNLSDLITEAEQWDARVDQKTWARLDAEDELKKIKVCPTCEQPIGSSAS